MLLPRSTVWLVQTVLSLLLRRKEEQEEQKLAMMVIMVRQRTEMDMKWRTLSKKQMQYGYSKRILAWPYQRILSSEQDLILLFLTILRRQELQRAHPTPIPRLMISIATRSQRLISKAPTGTMKLPITHRCKTIIYR